MHQFDFRRVDTEHFVGDLRQRCLHALTVRVSANEQFEAAVRRHPRARLFVAGHHRYAPAGIDRRAVGALLAIDGMTDADQSSVWLLAHLSATHALDIDHLDVAVQR